MLLKNVEKKFGGFCENIASETSILERESGENIGAENVFLAGIPFNSTEQRQCLCMSMNFC